MKKGLANAAGMIVTIFIVGVVLFYAVQMVGDDLARKRRIKELEEAGIMTEFEVPDPASTYREAASLTADLFVWEHEQHTRINRKFKITDQDYSIWTKNQHDRSLNKFDAETLAIRAKGFLFRKELDENFPTAVEQIFAKQDSIQGLLLRKNEVLYCYKIENMEKVFRTKKLIDEKKAYELFNTAIEMEEDDSDDVSLYMAYGIAPELMRKGCEETLEKGIASGEYWKAHEAVFYAERFVRMCKATIPSLEGARTEAARLEREYKKKIRSSSSSQSSSSSKKSSSSGKSSYSSGWSSGYSRDSWDHDIEAYYEDNMDEYDDFDDAYEGFLDDEGVWDDY